MSSLICVICLDDLQTKTPMSTTCGHVFCSECAASQFITRPSCPVCRTTQSFEQLIRLFPEYGTPVLDPPNSIFTAIPATTTTSSEILEPEPISFRFQQLQARQLLSQPQPRQMLQPVLRVQWPASRRPLVQPQNLQMLRPQAQSRLRVSGQELQALLIQRSVQPQHLGPEVSYVRQSQSSVVALQGQLNGARRGSGAVRRF